MNQIKQIAFVIAAIVLAGCSTTVAPTYPLAVQLADLRFAQPGLLEQTIGLDLRFTNPNPDPVRARGLRFTMDVNGSAFATGVSDGAFELPSLGEAIVPVTIRVQTAELISRVLTFEGSTIDYRIAGDLFLAGGIGNPGGGSVAFSGDSSITIPNLGRLPDT